MTENEVLSIIQEAVHDPKNNALREQIIDPIIEVLETPKGRNKYIEFGNQFLESNAIMLSKEYPTAWVVFPRKYVDEVLELFGFSVKSIKAILKELFKQIDETKTFSTVMLNPTNVIHSVVLFYSDMILHRQLRDSAKQQLGLSVYSAALKHFFKSSPPNESVMTYVYMNLLDGSWGVVKSENMINWIGGTMETCYGKWRTKLTVDMSMKVMVDFLNRTRTSFQQNIRGLANLYYDNLDKGNLVGNDVDGSDDYLETKTYSKIRDNLVRKIKMGDSLYKNKDKLYPVIARMKNVKVDTLYDFSQKISHDDIRMIINIIFYVFLIKERNDIDDINTNKFISRITNLPTAVDRAIQGKPIILPLTKKYEFDSSIIKAYICLIATYVMMRINDVKK